jgi:hypothetical protein
VRKTVLAVLTLAALALAVANINRATAETGKKPPPCKCGELGCGPDPWDPYPCIKEFLNK